MALFIFNRPDTTRRVLNTIAAARPQRLFVVADGPRGDHAGDERLCRQARGLLERVDWPCEISRNYSDVNLGCKGRISSGLDWVFSHVDEAIILEDDCLPHASFFPFCEELLIRYQDDERVHMVSGCNLLLGRRFGQSSYYFSRFYHVWGWATWARAWKHYDLEMRNWPVVRDRGWLGRFLPDTAMAGLARYIFDETYYADRFTTWDYQWVFSGWLRNALAITPSMNLVTNIGDGAGATHGDSRGHPLTDQAASAMEFPLRHPADVEVLEQADQAEWSLLYPGLDPKQTLSRRLRRKLENVIRGRPRHMAAR